MLDPIEVGQRYKTTGGSTVLVIRKADTVKFPPASYAVEIQYENGDTTLVWGDSKHGGCKDMNGEHSRLLVELLSSAHQPVQLDLF